MRILGLVMDTHDSGIALLENGVPELVIEEERLNRRKHTQRFPSGALAAALTERGLDLGAVDVMTTPWHVGRLRRSFAAAVLGRLPASVNLLRKSSRPTQRNHIVFLNQRLRRRLRRQFGDGPLPPLVNVGHHDAHAAAFFVSPFEEAAVLVMDGYGDDAATSVYLGRGNQLARQWHTGLFNSLGMVYTFVTGYLGFAGFADEGKVMALAAHGSDRLIGRFRDVVHRTANGRYAVNMAYFDYPAYGQIRPFKTAFLETFGAPRRRGEPIGPRHFDIARALQTVTEETVLHVVRHLARNVQTRNLCLTGGVALNCVANARIREETDFRNVWVPPIASDSGAPLGSALWHHHQTLKNPRRFRLEHAAFGLEYPEAAIRRALDARGLVYQRLGEDGLIARVARDLADGRIVGWFQGRFEMGPRALGQRSILADPRRPDMRDRINARIKRREDFRPFAPAILAERVHQLFDFAGEDPFMTMAPRVRPEAAHLIPAALHVDQTGRIQTVSRHHQPRFWRLIAAFSELTGVPALINTSFNSQEPIVASPEDAVACFERSGLDVLVMGDFYCARRYDAAAAAVAVDALSDGG